MDNRCVVVLVCGFRVEVICATWFDIHVAGIRVGCCVCQGCTSDAFQELGSVRVQEDDLHPTLGALGNGEELPQSEGSWEGLCGANRWVLPVVIQTALEPAAQVGDDLRI